MVIHKITNNYKNDYAKTMFPKNKDSYLKN